MDWIDETEYVFYDTEIIRPTCPDPPGAGPGQMLAG